MPKYYTALLTDIAHEYSPDFTLHCTHTYFGELTGLEIFNVKEMIVSYFMLHGTVKMDKVYFNIDAMFGPNMDIPVLKTRETHKLDALKPLRDVFYSIPGLCKSEYVEYKPHITCNYKAIDARFNCYALMEGKKVIRSWDIGKLI